MLELNTQNHVSKTSWPVYVNRLLHAVEKFLVEIFLTRIFSYEEILPALSSGRSILPGNTQPWIPSEDLLDTLAPTIGRTLRERGEAGELGKKGGRDLEGGRTLSIQGQMSQWHR